MEGHGGKGRRRTWASSKIRSSCRPPHTTIIPAPSAHAACAYRAAGGAPCVLGSLAARSVKRTVANEFVGRDLILPPNTRATVPVTTAVWECRCSSDHASRPAATALSRSESAAAAAAARRLRGLPVGLPGGETTGAPRGERSASMGTEHTTRSDKLVEGRARREIWADLGRSGGRFGEIWGEIWRTFDPLEDTPLGLGRCALLT